MARPKTHGNGITMSEAERDGCGAGFCLANPASALEVAHIKFQEVLMAGAAHTH